MYRIILIILICVIAIPYTSCSKPSAKQDSTTDTLSVDINKYAELNANIRKVGNISTPTELIRYYYGEAENSAQLQISTDQINDNQYLITLLEPNIKDDSIAEMMVIMKARNDNDEWTVIDIDRKWKCWDGRGHTKYSSEPCK